MKKSFLNKTITFIINNKSILLIIVTVTFWITAIAYSLYLGSSLRFPDENKYFYVYGHNLATLHLFSADGTNPTAYTPPLYPLLLGLLISIGSGIIGARIINFMALYLTIVVVYMILKKQSLKLSPIISFLLILGYPVLFYTAGTLYPQTIGSLFLVLSVYFFWEPDNSLKGSILAGLFLGLSILTIPTFIFVLPFLLVFAFFNKKKKLSRMFLLTIFTILTISPWTIRNYIVFDRFVLFSSNLGTIFLLGNSPSTTPNDSPSALVGMEKYIEQARNQGLNEFETNVFYVQSAIELIAKNPGHYIGLYLGKVLNYFNFRNELATKSESSPIRDLVMMITYGFLILVALIRLMLIRKISFSRLELFLFLLYLCSAFVNGLFFPRIRYRLPFDYLLILLAALSIERFILFQTEKANSSILLKD